MKRNINKKYNLIGFDLDGTLAESKSAVTPNMSESICKLLENYQVAVISGGDYPQFKKQLIQNLVSPKINILKNLIILPTCGAKYYKFDGDKWIKVYEEAIPQKNKDKIINTLNELIKRTPELQQEAYGEQIEDRGAQITLSALGQLAPIEEKRKWDPTKKIRLRLIEEIKKELEDFDIAIGGSTSIDITLKGLNKSYGMKKIIELTGIQKDSILYIGDDLKAGGNDYPIKQMGIDCIEVESPNETLELIQQIIDLG